ncbi:Putative integral membrane protein [Magnetospira sp. QH-2]|nr:Putative integral membrane protein [Magnetospira sp. QH-2]
MAGIGLLIWLLASSDLDQLSAALVAGGWGVVAIALFKIVTLGMDALAWRSVVLGDHRPGLGRTLWIRWIGEGVNTLLPVAQVGGDVVRGRLLALRGVPGPVAGASVAADFTMGVITQALFTLLAVALLVVHGLPEPLIAPVSVGLGVIGLGGLALLLIQRAGLFGLLGKLLDRLVKDGPWASLSGGMAALEMAVRRVYGDRRALLTCGGWRFVGWVAHLGETWLALWFLGVPVTLAEALVIEALSNAVRSAAFMIPGAIGVQEGGLLAVGLIYGLTPETALALAMMKRGRELLVSLPALAAWMHGERRGLGRLLKGKGA